MKKQLLTAVIMLLLTAISTNLVYADYQDMPEGVYKLDKTHASLTWKSIASGIVELYCAFHQF